MYKETDKSSVLKELSEDLIEVYAAGTTWRKW